MGCRLLKIVLGHRHGCGKGVLRDWMLAGVFPTRLVLDGPSKKKHCKNRGFGRGGGSAWQCSSSAVNSCSVNSGKIFFLIVEIARFPKIYGAMGVSAYISR